ncbi:hypothetical protein ABZ876_13315 [Streptomyces sp. NPDC046931]|uniref:hypothetical protein n=1 Tax=Streptomyces sp. NPDC046931 TaxID=3154806 RepID=UPI0033E7090D
MREGLPSSTETRDLLTIVVWYALRGHQPGDAAEQRERTPWFTTKTAPEPSDIVGKPRRMITEARFLPTTAGRPIRLP